jgi:hypothetical protein
MSPKLHISLTLPQVPALLSSGLSSLSSRLPWEQLQRLSYLFSHFLVGQLLFFSDSQ